MAWMIVDSKAMAQELEVLAVGAQNLFCGEVKDGQNLLVVRLHLKNLFE